MSSTSSVTGSSMVRLSGLSSGLDTDSLVKSLLQVDQTKVDKEYKLKTKLEWTGDAMRAVNLEIKNFREKYMSVLNPSTNMFTSSAYNAYTVTMGTATSAVSVTAGPSATAGSYTINKVTQLATSAIKSSESPMFTGDNIGVGSKLSDAFSEDTFDSDGNISFSINDKTFTFSKDTTISSMMSTINSDATANVTMSYSSLKKGFTIASKSTGASSSVKIANISGNAFADTADAAAFKISAGTKNGLNAMAQIEGVNVEKSSNTFTIDGITYSLKAETGAVNFSVDRDVDAVYNKISDFIDAYNTLVSDLQSKLDEEVNSDYAPLTDAERAKLSDTQAEKWDEKAKSGLLSDDNNIRSLLTNLRNAFYSAVSGAGKSASDLGLNTQAYATTGKITIDETKLKTALANNPDLVAKVFTSVSSATDASTKNKESGLITRISGLLNNYISTSTDVTLAQNTTQIKQATSELADLNDWLSNNEEKYYAKFTAMETALSKLNSQSGWLSSLLSSSSK